MDELKVDAFSNGEFVVIGEHISLERAKEMMSKEDPGAIVTEVKHYWVRYEWMTDEDIDDFDVGYGTTIRPQWWVLHETTLRPKGLTRKATELYVEF